MSSKINIKVLLITKCQILQYLLNKKLREFSIKYPPRFIWRNTFFQVELRKISSSLRLKQIDFPLRDSLSPSFPNLNIQLLFPSAVKRSGVMVESDIYFCYFNTLRDIQMTVNQYDLPKNVTNKSLRNRIKDNLELNPVDIIIQDGNCYYSPNLHVLTNYMQIQRDRGTKIIIDLPDCNITQDGLAQIEFWNKYADLIVYHNPYIPIPKKNSNFLIWPGFPIPLASYEYPWALKKNKLLMQGSTHRQRNSYLQGVRKAKLPVVSQQHNSKTNDQIASHYVQYLENIKSNKFVFTNGYLNSRESIIVGRAFETLASGSVLFYENGSKLSFFYGEYSDFIPIHNLADLIEKFEFLNRHESTAMEIGMNARKRTSQKYNSNLFWSTALSMLNFM